MLWLLILELLDKKDPLAQTLTRFHFLYFGPETAATLANDTLFAALKKAATTGTSEDKEDDAGTDEEAGTTEEEPAASTDSTQPADKDDNANATQKETELDVEIWGGAWEHYKAIPFYTEFGSGKALHFVAWIIHNFVSTFACNNGRKNYWREFDNHENLEWMTSDDFAFAFLVLQQYTTYWRLCYHKLAKKRLTSGNDALRDLTKSESKGVDGKQYGGDGVSSSLAQKRFREITKVFHKNYVQRNSEGGPNVNNRLLIQAVMALKDQEVKEHSDGDNSSDAGDSQSGSNGRVHQVAVDADYEAISTLEFGAMRFAI